MVLALALPALSALQTETVVWTSSVWDPLAYALCRYEEASDRWMEHPSTGTRLDNDQFSVVMVEDGRCTGRRPVSSDGTEQVQTWVVFDV